MWVRCGLIFLFSWVIIRRRGLVKALRSERPWLQFARSLILLIESAIFGLAFRHLPLADAHALAATSPLIVIALGVLFLGEKAGLARWLAVAAGFAGVLLIIQPGLRTVDWPVLLPPGGSGRWGGDQIL